MSPASPPPPPSDPRDDEEDPFLARMRRSPFPRDAGIGAIVLTTEPDPEPIPGSEAEAEAAPARPNPVAEGLKSLLASLGRPHEVVVRSIVPRGVAAAIRDGLAATSHPIVLVTHASAPWTPAHLEPALAAIDESDHVWGVRDAGFVERLERRLRRLPWRVLFAIPTLDPATPCRLHRREALEALALQSESGFLFVEIPAKATYLVHALTEVPVPPLDAPAIPSKSSDFRRLWREPVFAAPPPTP